jgi:hypothetical protein
MSPIALETAITSVVQLRVGCIRGEVDDSAVEAKLNRSSNARTQKPSADTLAVHATPDSPPHRTPLKATNSIARAASFHAGSSMITVSTCESTSRSQEATMQPHTTSHRTMAATQGEGFPSAGSMLKTTYATQMLRDATLISSKLGRTAAHRQGRAMERRPRSAESSSTRCGSIDSRAAHL